MTPRSWGYCICHYLVINAKARRLKNTSYKTAYKIGQIFSLSNIKFSIIQVWGGNSSLHISFSTIFVWKWGCRLFCVCVERIVG